MKKVVVSLLVFLLFGCLAARVSAFDPIDFGSVKKIALVIEVIETQAYNNFLKMVKHPYEMPIVWREEVSESPSYGADVPMGSIGSVDIAAGIYFQSDSGLDIIVHKDDTEKLRSLVGDYNFTSRVTESFVEKLNRMGSFDFIPSKDVKALYNELLPNYKQISKKARSKGLSAKEKKKLKKEAIKEAEEKFINNFYNTLRTRGADVLISLRIFEWGFLREEERGFFGIDGSDEKGNLSASFGLDAVRLSVQEIIWADVVIVDFSEKYGKKTLDEFLQENQESPSQAVDELVETATSLLVGHLGRQAAPKE